MGRLGLSEEVILCIFTVVKSDISHIIYRENVIEEYSCVEL